MDYICTVPVHATVANVAKNKIMNACRSFYSVVKKLQSALARPDIGGVFHKEKKRPFGKKIMIASVTLFNIQVQIWLQWKLGVFHSGPPP